MEKMLSPELVRKYPISAKEYQNAVKLMEMGMVVGSLTSARVSLENIVKELCKKSGIDTSDVNQDITLKDMIDALKENGIFSEAEVTIIHKIRILCNRGAHPGDVPPELEDAKEATALLFSILNLFDQRDSECDFEQQKVHNNTPMKRSNYYDPKRKYVGEWAFCYSREDLFCIPEYAQLYQKAEHGDISAMLDLAIGFLPKKDRVWGKDGIVCMPKYRSYYDSDNDAVDYRYYYWILRACECSVTNEHKGNPYPKKYMATAFFEGLKFLAHKRSFKEGSYVTDIRDGDVCWGSPHELASSIYGEDSVSYPHSQNQWAICLMSLLDEYGVEAIDPLHGKQRSKEAIRFLLACTYFSLDLNEEIPDYSCDFFGFEESVITIEQLEKLKPYDGSCDDLFKGCRFKVALKKYEEEEKARRLADREMYKKEIEEKRREAEKSAKQGCLLTVALVILIIAGLWVQVAEFL